MTTFYYSHKTCLEHTTPHGHPERADRLRVVDDVLRKSEFYDLVKHEAPSADTNSFLLAHPKDFVKSIEQKIPETGIVQIDGDTLASPKSLEAVKHAVGAGIAGVDAVFEGKADNVFAGMRPPGHHAEKATAMGFCFVNSIAIAARHAQKQHGAERVAIVDFDVHHGNGTQDIFYDDDSVLFCSSHQMPLFPGSGALNEEGVGNIFNAPLKHGDAGDVFKQAYIDRIFPAIENFAPDIILVSAGFDAHYRDPLGGLQLTLNDFDWVTGELMELAGKHCENRLVSLLEGGYDLEGLGESVQAHVSRLIKG
ncbi:MAG: histone deacetylase family protein [Nitratireductor sp.]